MAIETVKNIFQFRHSASPVEAFAKKEREWIKTPDSLARYVKTAAGHLFVGLPACILGIAYHTVGTGVTLVGFAVVRAFGRFKFGTDTELAKGDWAKELTFGNAVFHAYKIFMVTFAIPSIIPFIFSPGRGTLGFLEDTAVVSPPRQAEESAADKVQKQPQPLKKDGVVTEDDNNTQKVEKDETQSKAKKTKAEEQETQSKAKKAKKAEAEAKKDDAKAKKAKAKKDDAEAKRAEAKVKKDDAKAKNAKAKKDDAKAKKAKAKKDDAKAKKAEEKVKKDDTKAKAKPKTFRTDTPNKHLKRKKRVFNPNI